MKLKVMAKLWLHPIFPRSRIIMRLCDSYLRLYYNESWTSSINGEDYLISYLKGILPVQPIVFDVGANFGDWSTYFISIHPDAIIHTFEPALSTYKALTSRLDDEKFHHNNLGVSSEDGVAKLNINDHRSQLNSIYRDPQPSLHIDTEEIKLTSLENYCNRHNIAHIDYLKIDVEGHELAVLEGSSNLLKDKRITFIQFEFRGTRSQIRVYFKDIFELLQNHGYVVGRIHPKNICIIDEYDFRLEYRFANYIACIPSFVKNLNLQVY